MAHGTILIADDDEDTRIILRTVLESQDYEVVEAATGDDAVARARALDFALVILNYPMTLADGRSLARALRALGITRTPILNFTSRAVPQYLQEAAAAGCDVSVAKPLDIGKIMELVRSLTRPRLMLAR